MSALRSSRPLVRRSAACSQTRSASSANPVPPVPWTSKTHVAKPPTVPNPVPALFPQKVVLSDGSTFTSYSTAPTPQIMRLTRDITNNPLWFPGMESASKDGSMEGRIGKFRRRFDAAQQQQPQTQAQGEAEDAEVAAQDKAHSAFSAADLSWMSEGAEEDKTADWQRGGIKKAKKGKGGKK